MFFFQFFLPFVFLHTSNLIFYREMTVYLEKSDRAIGGWDEFGIPGDRGPYRAANRRRKLVVFIDFFFFFAVTSKIRRGRRIRFFRHL